jgi:hypothetical protein
VVVAAYRKPEIGKLHSIIRTASIESWRPGTGSYKRLKAEGCCWTPRCVPDLVVVTDFQRSRKECKRFPRVSDMLESFLCALMEQMQRGIPPTNKLGGFRWPSQDALVLGVVSQVIVDTVL